MAKAIQTGATSNRSGKCPEVAILSGVCHSVLLRLFLPTPLMTRTTFSHSMVDEGHTTQVVHATTRERTKTSACKIGLRTTKQQLDGSSHMWQSTVKFISVACTPSVTLGSNTHYTRSIDPAPQINSRLHPHYTTQLRRNRKVKACLAGAIARMEGR